MSTKQSNKPVKLPSEVQGKKISLQIVLPSTAPRQTAGGNGVIETSFVIPSPIGEIRAFVSIYVPVNAVNKPESPTVQAEAKLI